MYYVYHVFNLIISFFFITKYCRIGKLIEMDKLVLVTPLDYLSETYLRREKSLLVIEHLLIFCQHNSKFCTFKYQKIVFFCSLPPIVATEYSCLWLCRSKVPVVISNNPPNFMFLKSFIELVLDVFK